MDCQNFDLFLPCLPVVGLQSNWGTGTWLNSRKAQYITSGGNMKVSMSDLRAKHPLYFDRKTVRFFGDCRYSTRVGKSHKLYMVRSTYMWSDMFGSPKRICYRINPINAETLEIEPLIETIFKSMDDVNDWLKEN
jgi:hypothetical protein